ncbi:MAG: flagellar motor switch protein FliM [Planctomycetota bacterium]
MDDILSEDELNALLDAVEHDPSSAMEPQRVVDYDFARPDKLNPDQIRSLQRMHESIAQDFEYHLARLLQVSVEVALVSLGQLSFDVFHASLSNPTALQVLEMSGAPERCIMTVDSKLAFSLIDRMLGGRGKALDRPRALTMVEESLIDNVTDRFQGLLSEAWSRLQPIRFKVIERESDPQFAQVIPAGEMVLVSTFSIQGPEEMEPGELCMAIPFINLEGAVGKLSSQTRFAQIDLRQTPEQREHIDRIVSDTMVPLRIELGTATLRIGEVLAMSKGDVIVLDQPRDEPMQGHLAGLYKLQGRPGRIGRKVGFLVEQLLPRGPLPEVVPSKARGAEELKYG